MKQGKYKATAKDNLELDDNGLCWIKGEIYDAEVNELGEMTLQSERGQSYYTANAVEKLKDMFDFEEDNDRYTPKKPIKHITPEDIKLGCVTMKLKPCPFCGGKAEICATPWDFTKKRPQENHKFIVECSECLVQTDEFETRERAAEKWNGRVKNE